MLNIDAGILSRELDRSASEWTPETLHQTFWNHGCAVVRGAVDPSTQSLVKDAIDAAYATKLDELHVHDPDIAAATEGSVSGWELADTPLLQGFLKLAFARQGWRRDSVTARRIQGIEANQDWQKPLELHLDSQFHGLNFTVNFWTPFDPCGVDAPSLQLVPLDYRRTRAYSNYTGKLLRENEHWHFGYFRADILDPAAAIKAFGPNCFLRPQMMPGDVIVSSNWIIHGSYRTPQMRKGRTNAELRFMGSTLDLQRPGRGGALARLANLFRRVDDRVSLHQ